MTTTNAPAPRFIDAARRLADIERDLRTGAVVRVANGGPELRIESMERVNSELGGVTVVLAILTGMFAGSTVTRYWHDNDQIQIIRGAVSSLPFLAIVPANYGPGLPECPDGSGDLWWDDASYIRYQSFEPTYDPAYIADGFDAGFCDGKRAPQWYDAPSCSCHAAAPLTDDEIADCPF